ncbi:MULTISPECIES: response regulator transcription factor [Alteromonas]|jgi:DNA-binding NarL/FixJ family response regulator|uniref:Response regulator transcription factor n=1 Tax=Alteromonas stellipolaris TaxID=233316 RepID=A0AAW7YWS7_9ALTE|nr:MULTISPECIES: response regulator transcription factor [Alteromonas]AMJ90046.1 LuxR family transcriptional regulator [Alteromonas sp. Mac2]AMJ86187.1 LuxR family transcriptional regulator [Alteromonas sp. Mac1]AMJ93890.1 LuxR family transcriptional regulator [Alteromonas stellipolaris]ANB22586.1 DNA-binding response regulator [Alteromonas stellipolaris]ANB27098.1 DNA-binding response regulator [Alteromonas stellipolaris]|mmetsp:Transcript_6059/g.15457  ORF Transcript_6059/g.15457 Transcript_6059/m.15457 type:complete len:212 (-) Transcript_6059:7-642(-)
MTRILVADDHPLFREALSGALGPYFENAQILEAGSLDAALAILNEYDGIELVLLDLNMPGGEYFNGIITLREQYPNIPIGVVSGSDTVEVVAQVMSLGAQGFIPKVSATREMAQAIVDIIAGKKWLPEGMEEELEKVDDELKLLLQRFRELTPKQIQVLSFLRAGLMNKQIAHEMNVTEATIKAHISAILRKLEINTRTQAVLLMDKLQLS